MSDPRRYPLTLNHPAYRAATMTPSVTTYPGGKQITDWHGTPDRYAPVTVNNADQEAHHRALGYLDPGESSPMVAFAEYPLMLVHPQHVPAIPDEKYPHKDPTTGAVSILTKPGSPELFPPVQVNDAAEEERWKGKGYKRGGQGDPDAVQKAVAAPHDPGFRHEEWPKMVKGVLMKDPDAPAAFQEYPKWVGEHLVNSAAEEKALGLTVEVALERAEERKTVPPAPDAATALAEAEAKIAALEARLAVAQAAPAADPVAEKRAKARDRMARARAAKRESAAA